VTAFLKKHGDHAVQHFAFLVQDLGTFRTQVMEFGVNLLGPILQRHDGFGYVRQVFARGYHDDTNPAEVGFPEFVERPLHKGAAFPRFRSQPRLAPTFTGRLRMPWTGMNGSHRWIFPRCRRIGSPHSSSAARPARVGCHTFVTIHDLRDLDQKLGENPHPGALESPQRSYNPRMLRAIIWRFTCAVVFRKSNRSEKN